MDNIMVSVIMANYNTPLEYLKVAVDSILEQTYNNFELIVIDDASTDHSIKYLESIEDPRVVLIKNTQNLGPAISRNKGIDIARGKYIAIMDSDDISRPERLSTQVQYMEVNTDVIVCGSWFNKFGIENRARTPVINDFELYRCQLLFSNTPTTMCHSTAMLRKSLLDRYNLRYDSTLPKAQDYGMWTVCSQYGRMYIIDRVLLDYRTHTEQISTKTREKQTFYSDLISRRQLQALGVPFCDEEKRWRFDNVIDKDDYLHFYNWIQNIKELNYESKQFDVDKLFVYLDKKLENAIKRLRLIEIIKVYFTTNKHTRKIICNLFINYVKVRLGYAKS